jgi:hypothetical protein
MTLLFLNSFQPDLYRAGADPGFQVRVGVQLKKLRRAEGGAKIFGVFHVKNHDFTPRKSIFFPMLGGGARRVRPPLNPPLQSPVRKEYIGDVTNP